MEAWISYHNQKMTVMFDFCFNNYKWKGMENLVDFLLWTHSCRH